MAKPFPGFSDAQTQLNALRVEDFYAWLLRRPTRRFAESCDPLQIWVSVMLRCPILLVYDPDAYDSLSEGVVATPIRRGRGSFALAVPGWFKNHTDLTQETSLTAFEILQKFGQVATEES
jgi:hypothetical protein